MSYDYADPAWQDTTGHNAPLVDPANSKWNVEANIVQWIAHGADRHKMVMGGSLCCFLTLQL